MNGLADRLPRQPCVSLHSLIPSWNAINKRVAWRLNRTMYEYVTHNIMLQLCLSLCNKEINNSNHVGQLRSSQTHYYVFGVDINYFFHVFPRPLRPASSPDSFVSILSICSCEEWYFFKNRNIKTNFCHFIWSNRFYCGTSYTHITWEFLIKIWC